MFQILHRIGIDAPIEAVHQALGTRDGVAGWWSTDVQGDAAPGGRLSFRFGNPEPRLVLEVRRNEPDVVAWHCIDAPEDWADSDIVFTLSRLDDQTIVNFRHELREPTEFLAHCSTKWAYFLLGLKASFAGGKATPFPHDMHLSSWS